MLTDEQLGGIAAQLALEFPAWIQRRVEHVTHLDLATLRQMEGVMFRWPSPDFFLPGAQPAPGDLVYVPLDLLTKEPLTGLDGSGPDGSPLPILSFTRSAAIASAGMTAMVWGRSQAMRGHGLDPESVQILDSIIRSPPRLARKLLRILDDSTSDLGEILADHTQIRGLLEELAANAPLLIPATYRPNEEVVYRYTYCHSLPRKEPRSKLLAATLGFKDISVIHQRLSFGWSASYYFEVDAPGEVKITRALLRGQYGTHTTQRCLIAEAAGSPAVALYAQRPTEQAFADGQAVNPTVRPPVLPALDHEALTPGLVAAALAAKPSETQRSDQGEAEILLRLDPFGTFLAAMVVSLLTAILLGAALTRLPELDGQTSATLLLALPVLTLGYLTRPGEHAFATRLLGGIRAIALAVGICALALAAILAMGLVRHRPAETHGNPCTATIQIPTVSADGDHNRQLRRDVRGRRYLRDWPWSGHLSEHAGPASGEASCSPAATKPAMTSVPATTQAAADLATGLAGLLALILLAGWICTWRRPAGLLPEPPTGHT